MDGLMTLHVQDPDLVVYTPGHKSAGPAQVREMIEEDLKEYDSEEWTFAETSVSAAGSVAWATADATVVLKKAGQTAGTFPLRLTFVLEQRGGKWLIAHGHVSLAAGSRQGLADPADNA